MPVISQESLDSVKDPLFRGEGNPPSRPKRNGVNVRLRGALVSYEGDTMTTAELRGKEEKVGYKEEVRGQVREGGFSANETYAIEGSRISSFTQAHQEQKSGVHSIVNREVPKRGRCDPDFSFLRMLGSQNNHGRQM